MIPVAVPYVRRASILCLCPELILLVCLQKEYAQEIADRLSALGLFADVDNGADTLPKKIRNGEIAHYNFLLGALHVLSRSLILMTIFFCLSRGPRRTRQSVCQRSKQGRRGYEIKGRDGTARRGDCQAGRTQELTTPRQ